MGSLNYTPYKHFNPYQVFIIDIIWFIIIKTNIIKCTITLKLELITFNHFNLYALKLLSNYSNKIIINQKYY